METYDGPAAVGENPKIPGSRLWGKNNPLVVVLVSGGKITPSWRLGKKQNPWILTLDFGWFIILADILLAGILLVTLLADILLADLVLADILLADILFAGLTLAVTYVGGGFTRAVPTGGGVACRGRAIFCPVSLFDARSSPGDLIAEWS
jgi:hypothetical protein